MLFQLWLHGISVGFAGWPKENGIEIQWDSSNKNGTKSETAWYYNMWLWLKMAPPKKNLSRYSLLFVWVFWYWTLLYTMFWLEDDWSCFLILSSNTSQWNIWWFIVGFCRDKQDILTPAKRAMIPSKPRHWMEVFLAPLPKRIQPCSLVENLKLNGCKNLGWHHLEGS